MNQNLTKQSRESAVTLNKISIQEFKTQQEQQVDQRETLTREATRKTKVKE